MKAYTIDIKKAHGLIVVNAKGRTGRGQSFIKASRTLPLVDISDKKFKAEMAKAVSEMLESDA